MQLKFAVQVPFCSGTPFGVEVQRRTGVTGLLAGSAPSGSVM